MDPRYGIKHGPTSVPVLVQIDSVGRKGNLAEEVQVIELNTGT